MAAEEQAGTTVQDDSPAPTVPIDQAEVEATDRFLAGRGIDPNAEAPVRRGVFDRQHIETAPPRPASLAERAASAAPERNASEPSVSRGAPPAQRPQSRTPAERRAERLASQERAPVEDEAALLDDLTGLSEPEGDEEPLEEPEGDLPPETQFSDAELDQLAGALATLSGGQPPPGETYFARRETNRLNQRIQQLEQMVVRALQGGQPLPQAPAGAAAQPAAASGPEAVLQRLFPNGLPEDFFDQPGPALAQAFSPLLERLDQLEQVMNENRRTSAVNDLRSAELEYDRANPGYLERLNQGRELFFQDLVDTGFPPEDAAQMVQQRELGWLRIAQEYGRRGIRVSPMQLADRDARRWIAVAGGAPPAAAAPARRPAPAPAPSTGRVAAAIASRRSPSARSLAEAPDAAPPPATAGLGGGREHVLGLYRRGGRSAFLADTERAERAAQQRR